MCLGDVPAEREQHRHRVLGGRHDVRRRRVDDEDAARRGRIDVDVVEADASASDDAKTISGVDELRCHCSAAAGDERVRLRDRFQKVGALEAGAVIEIDVVSLTKDLEA